MVGNNLKAHLEYLQKKMRDAAADLNFEEAARLRDEIKRLTELELALSDDPLAREVESAEPVIGREKGKHNKGVAKHRTAEEQERFRQLDAARAAEEAAKAARPNLFRKPELDEMGTSGDHAVPAGAVPRSLFKKQSAKEAHEVRLRRSRRRRAPVAVPQELARRDDCPPHRKAGGKGQAGQARENRRRLL